MCQSHTHAVHIRGDVFCLVLPMKWEGMVPKLWGLEVGFLNVIRAHLLDQNICVSCMQSLKLAWEIRTHLVEFHKWSNPITMNIFMVTISPVI